MSPATVDNSVRDMGERLRAPFPAKDICWRIGSTTEDKDRGLALAYIDARAVQRRLDELFGWDGWRTEYHSLNGSGVICALSVRVDGDLWITKQDGADPTDVEATKGGISDAFKRAAASGFGIGRYVYDLPPAWTEIERRGKSYVIKTPPPLPAWAVPEGDDTAPAAEPLDAEGDYQRQQAGNEPEDPAIDQMRRDLNDMDWLTPEQWTAVCNGITPPEGAQGPNDWDAATVTKAHALAVGMRGEAAPAPEADTPTHGPYTKCPGCKTADVWDNRVERKAQQAEIAANGFRIKKDGGQTKSARCAWVCKDRCGWEQWESGDHADPVKPKGG